jgi:hypothetical protein
MAAVLLLLLGSVPPSVPNPLVGFSRRAAGEALLGERLASGLGLARLSLAGTGASIASAVTRRR